MFISILSILFNTDALLADLQSTIQKTNKLNGGGINGGGYGSINNGIQSRLASAGSPIPQNSIQSPDYATIRSHKIERSTSSPAVRQELSVYIILFLYLLIYLQYVVYNIKYIVSIDYST